MSENVIEIKSKAFAIKIVNMYKWICEEKREYILSKQCLRSSSSIGANVAEAQEPQSQNDFIAKLYIALKEASETKYWLRLLSATNYLTEKESGSLLHDCTELEKLLTAIIKTTKAKR